MQPDPIIDQIREVRHRISEQCGHDPERLIEYYMKLEREEYADRLLKSSVVEPTGAGALPAEEPGTPGPSGHR